MGTSQLTGSSGSPIADTERRRDSPPPRFSLGESARLPVEDPLFLLFPHPIGGLGEQGTTTSSLENRGPHVTVPLESTACRPSPMAWWKHSGSMR